MAPSKLKPAWRIAFVVRDAADFSKVLLVRSAAPSSIASHEHRDSDIWDLPCVELSRTKKGQQQHLRGSIDHPQLVCRLEAALQEAGLQNFDVLEAIDKVQLLVPSPLHFSTVWKIFREPDFGPTPSMETAMVIVEAPSFASSPGISQWFDPQKALQLLVNETCHVDRIGILAAHFFYPFFPRGTCRDLKLDCSYQEYPPGVLVIPMLSRTIRPFCKTNLVVSAAANPQLSTLQLDDGTLTGEALIVDPGCSVPVQKELVAIVGLLPKKLLVFITHHHLDHTEGLPAVKQSNSDATVIAHEKTLKRMGKVLDGIDYVPVVGGTKLLVSGQRFEVIDAPGHTDGHLCLFHLDTRTLVAGDHCVGEGSSILDANSGGNLDDYMNTSHRLLELAPKVVVPMHGRPNLFPLSLLNEYIRHRKTREDMVSKAIYAGATSAFAIVSDAYKQTNIWLWPAALLNVKAHVDHLQKQEKLPEGFSMDKFKHSCGFPFKVRWSAEVIASYVSRYGVLSILVCLCAVVCYYFSRPRNV